MRTRTIITALILAGSALITPPAAARATLPSVSPGDQIDYMSGHESQTFCTLGYVYIGQDDHVYGVTAGHCQPDMPGYIRDQNSGATARFIHATVAPPHTGGPDYGLLDFGRHVMAVSFIGNNPVSNTPVPTPHPGETICRTGVSSGQHCGTVAHAYGDDQYLTTGMPASIGGDSGGPVWYCDDTGATHVIGIWLGEKTTDHDRFGRFAALAAGLRILT